MLTFEQAESNRAKNKKTSKTSSLTFETVEQNRKASLMPTVRSDIQSKYQELMKDYSNYANEYNIRSSRSGYISDSADWWKRTTNLYDSFSKRSKELTDLIDNNKGAIDEDTANSIKKSLTDASYNIYSGRISSKTLNDYYSQFKDEEDYNYSVGFSNQYKDYSYDDLMNEASKTTDTKKSNWINNYANTKTYETSADYEKAIASATSNYDAFLKEKQDIQTRMSGYRRGQLTYTDQYKTDEKRLKEIDAEIEKAKESKQVLTNQLTLKQREEKIQNEYMSAQGNADFESVSSNRNFNNPTKEEMDKYDVRINSGITYDANGVGRDVFGEVFDDTYYDRVQEPQVSDRLGLFLGTDKATREQAYANTAGEESQWESVMKDGIDSDWDQLTDKEVEVYYYLLNTDGQEKAEQFLSDMKVELNRRASNESAENIAHANTLEKIALNIASVPANVFGGIVSFAEDTLNVISGNEINPYSKAHSLVNVATTTRSETAKDIQTGLGDGTLGTLVSNTYQAVMSGADSLLGATTLGGKYTVTMGMGAASQKAQELYERGASSSQIALGALASGAIEWITEKWSYDFIVDKIWNNPVSGKNLIKAVLASAGNEGIEEVNADILNMISESIIQGYNSENEEKVRELINKGLTEQEARSQVVAENAINTFWSFYGGFISGGLMSLGQAGIKAYDTSNYYNSVYGDNQAELIAEGLESAPDTESYKLANKFKAKADKGKSLSGLQIGQLVEANSQAIAEEEKAQKATEAEAKAKEKLGVSENITDKIYESESTKEIKKIKSISDGKMVFELEDGSEVDSDNISYTSENKAIIYESLLSSKYDVNTANAIANAFDTTKDTSASAYMLGIQEAYNYGKVGYPQDKINTNGYYADLTESQQKFAYDLGKNASTIQYSAEQTTINNAKTDVTKKGKVHLPVNYSSLTERQKTSISTIGRVVAEITNNDVYFYESVLKDGKRVFSNDTTKSAPNGFYNPADGSIHIDLNAGNNGEGVILWTAAHELTHFTRQWSPEKFKGLSDFLMNEYGKKGVDINTLVQDQITKAKNNGREIDFDTAYEEVVADSMSQMFTDTNLAEKLSKLKTQDKTLWQKIKDFFANLYKKITEVYKGLNPQTQEAKYVREMKDSIEKISDLFAEALVDAGEAYSSVDNVLLNNGIYVNSETESGGIMSVRDVLDDKKRIEVAKALAVRFGVTETEANNWLTAETSLASLILNPKYSQYLDYEADPDEVAIKLNSDYPQGTVDFSNICAKRREFTSVMNSVLRNFPNHIFAATDLAKIRTIMREEGMTIPCGICYVEDRRQLDTIIAQDFIDGLKLYREGSKTRPDGKPFNANQLKGLKLTDGDTYVPSVYELVSLEGRNKLKAKNPNMEAAWVKYNNARGMQAVRLLANEAEYKRQILKYNKKTVQSKNDHGGLRIYSFSDAEMFHLIDIIQVITDSATVGLSLQGYTKVNEYAKAVKDTGEKLNRSLIPKGELGYHIENGKVVLDYDTVEGIDINSKDFFDNKDNPDIGNITIGVSDVQIRAAMVSDFVDQIIPFHTGQSEEVLGEKGIATWKNYKDYQTEKDIATGKTSDHQINIYTEVLQALEKEGTPITKRSFVEKFLQVCNDNGLTPRFAQFLNTDANGDYVYTEGYHKMLVDFKTFAQTEVGEYLPQMPVKPIFDNAYITQLLKDYVVSQKTKDAELAKSMPKVTDRITKEIINPSEKFSDRDSNYFNELYTVLKDGRIKPNNVNDLSTEDWKIIYKAVNKLGYGLNSVKEAKEVYSKYVGENGFNAEQSKAIMNGYGVGNAKTNGVNLERVKAAKKEYGTTTDFREAGYLLPDGYMLDFSGKKEGGEAHVRYMDHREISRVFDSSEVTSSYGDNTPYMNAFISEGNIRLMESQGVTIGEIEPTSKQYTMLKRFIDHVIDAEGYFYLDLSNNKGYTVASREYSKGDSSSRIIQDIKSYFKEGELPYRSRLQDFRYSDRDSEGNKLTEAQQEFFKDSKVRDENGNLLKVWHGTNDGGFTTFEKRFVNGFYFTDNINVADTYSGYGTEFSPNRTDDITNADYRANYGVYLNIKNPLEVDANGKSWENIIYDGKDTTTEEIVDQAYNDGYDGVFFYNVIDSGGYNPGYSKTSNVYVALNSNQIKSTANINPTSDPDIRYSFRGEESAIEKENLDIAKEMDSKKTPMENIRLATGWFKQSDGKWRNEFSDKNAKLKSSALVHFALNDTASELDRLFKNANELSKKVNDLILSGDYDGANELALERKNAVADFKGYNSRLVREAKSREDATYKLKDLLTFPELFKSYPQLSNMEVNISGTSTSTLGLYDLKGKFINLSKAISQDQALVTLLHEVQHAIQDIEGMPQDNNRSYGNRRVEIEASDVETRHNLTDKQRQETAPVKFSDRVLMGSLFSGGGTLEAGLIYQMVDKEFAVEYNKQIASVYMDNHGKEHMFVGDVRDFNSKGKQSVFYLHASPVCKNFSSAKKNGGETTIDIVTAKATARVLEEQMPQVFTVENVKRYKGSEAYNLIVNKLDELGYKWDVDVYDSADYGAATSRERLIIRAVKDGELPSKPTKIGSKSWYSVVSDLINDLPEAPMPNWMKERYNAGNYDTDKPLFILGGNKGYGLSVAYADETAPTLLANSHDARIVMPDGRVLRATPRVLARIQGLPDDYKLPKSTTRAYTVIGNGIPTQLTKAVMGGVLDSAYSQTHNGEVLYSDRVTNRELLDSDTESALYIKNTKNANYIGMILNGTKTVETRSSRTLDSFIGREMPITDGKYVYGYMTLGEPYEISAKDFHKKENQQKHRVPKGDKYDVKDGKSKWAYPIESYRKIDKQKLSDSKDYKYSFQAREVKFADTSTGEDVKFSIREEEPPKKTIKGYKVFFVKDGKLYPPMVANPNGADTPVGVWLNADIGTQAPDSKTGRKQVKAGGKGTQGGSGSLAFRPGWHLGETPLATQFDRLNPETGIKELFPENFVWAECDVAADVDYQEKAMSYGYTKSGKFQHSLAGLPELPVDGYYRYRTNPNPNTVPWLITGAMRVSRLLSDAEVNEILAKEGIAPKQRQGGNKTLAELGLSQYEGVKYSDRNTDATDNRTLLSNALATTAQNDIEKKYIEDYQSKIDTINEEQKKLTELRAKIKELSFAKGHRDAGQISKLQAEATKTANRINTFDKQLLRLESTKPLQEVLNRERTLAKKKAKKVAKENLNAYREKAAETQRELMNRYQERIHRGVENREKTQVRNKIKKTIKTLNTLLKNGKGKTNVKNGLRGAVEQALSTADVLFSSLENEDIFNAGITAVTEEERANLVKYGELLAQRETLEDEQEIAKNKNAISRMESKLKDVFIRERSRLQEESVSTAIEELISAYEETSKSQQSHIKDAYDGNIADRLNSLKESLKGTTVKDMSLEQLKAVYEAYKMILHSVTTADKIFRQGKYEETSENANAVMDEVSKTHKMRDSRARMEDSALTATWNELKPVYAFERIASPTLMKAYKDIAEGESVWGRDVYEANKFAKEVREKYGYDSWDRTQMHRVRLSSGREIDLTLPQMMSIYAYSKRKQALKHMEIGGFAFKSAFKKSGKIFKNGLLEYLPTRGDTFRLSATDLETIKNMIEPQTKYVDEMQDYLSTVMGAKGNEASNILYGIDLFKEKFYFPLKSSKDFVASQNTPAGEVSLKNEGMTKETVPEASNPITLEDFDNVWANHVSKMSTYHAFVVPIDNFNKIYNFTDYYTNKDYSSSVKTIITSAFGNGVGEYISKLLVDINGGAMTDRVSSPFIGLVGKFKKTAVAASLSVIVQQPTAVIRAMAMVDPKYFKVDRSMSHSAKWDQLKQYAPVAVIKEIGGFDVGSNRQASSYLTEDQTLMDKADDKLMRGAGFADEIGWNMIWDAVKREVSDKQGLSGEELLIEAGKRFTEVIQYTQVYDSTLSRSGFMRSKSDINKMATSFMGEPTTSFNMLYNAVLQAKRGTMSKGQAVRTIAYVFASIVAANALKSIVGAGRDDDDDKTFIEKYMKSLASNLASDLFIPNMLPYIKDAVSIFEGWDVERTDMALVSDLYQSYKALSSETKSTYRKIEEFGGAIGNLFGVPARNIMRDARAIFTIATSFFDGNTTTAEGIGYAIVEGLTGDSKFKQIKSDLLDSFDFKSFDNTTGTDIRSKSKKLIDYYVDGGKTEKEAKSQVRSALTTYLKPLFLEAYQSNDSTTMANIRKCMNATGVYTDVVETTQEWIKNSKK